MRWPSGLALLLAMAAGCGSGSGDPIVDAEKLLEEGRPFEAVEALRVLLATTPSDYSTNLLYGRALMQTGQPSLAVWALARAMADPDRGAEAGLLLARAQIDSGSLDEAILTIDRLLARDPDAPELLLLRIEANMTAKREGDALVDIDRALEKTPDHLGLNMTRLQALLALNRSDEARKALSAIRSRIQELDSLSPDQKELLAGRYCAAEASFLHESHQDKEADAALEKCIEDFPTHPGVVSAAVRYFDESGKAERATELLRKALDAEPEKLPLRVELATRLRVAGDAAAAEALLRDVAERQPAAWSALADHFLALEQQAPALDALDHAISAAAPNVPPDWTLMRADLLIQLERFDAAEKAVEALEQPVYQHVARGRLLLARGDPKRALEELDQGVRLWPDGTMARYLAGQAAEQLGDFDRAENEYREAFRSDRAYTDAGLVYGELIGSRGRYEEAIALLREYSKMKPADPRGFELAIRYSYLTGKPRLAASLLETYRGRPELRVPSAAFVIRSALEREGAPAALRSLGAIQMDLEDPGNAEVLAAAAEALAASGSPGQALARADAALAAHPETAEFHRIRGQILLSQGSRDEARKSFERALELDRKNAAALSGLAKIAELAGDPAGAVALLDRAAAAAPEDPEPAFSAARIQLARGPGQDGEARLEALLRRHPRHAGAARELALLLLARGEGAQPRALDLGRRAVRFGKGAGDFDVLGRVFMAQGNASKAVESFQRAVELQPDSPSCRYRLALALVEVGRLEEARDALRKAVQAGPFPESEEARKTLASLERPA